jgi:pimeloyl-ACP methyl ester carboxylesterase
VIVGQSFSGGATTIAAATNPDLVIAIVEIDPFTRPPTYGAGAFLRNSGYRRGALLLGRFTLTGSVKTWSKYLNVAYPGRKPADWDTWLAALQANLSEPGRTKAAKKMIGSSATLKQAAAQLADVRCPALVVMGSSDSDFPDPEGEAAAIVGLLPAGLGRYVMIKNAGHHPHAEYPQAVEASVIPFLAERNHA